MSDSKDTGTPNIFSLNKKLKDSLDEIDTRFKHLEKTIELGHSNTAGRMGKVEEQNANIEKILVQMQKSLSTLIQSKGNPKESKEDAEKKLFRQEVSDKGKGKEKERDRKEENFPASSSTAPKKPLVKRTKFGRIDMSPIIENDSNLTPGEKFVKKAWPEAIFPGSIQDDAFTSVKNKVILKPEWQLIRADSEVFRKLSNIQNALQMALIPYHLWSQRVIMDMSGDFHGVRVWAMGEHPT
ncbi:hypothetical protein EV44_g3586 [Erysiphe necator]|uniref:Uncharacterized protein n=1 Tax=Uncinula necator TaxID=52586 RepID=A0A0B1PD81_UNCNE|nr:hypothetical protein EV44_g3586 [Erysiphe necator]